MSNPTTVANPSVRHRPSPPSKHQLALMIWLSVFPTLTVINFVLGDWLAALPQLLRTLVLTTVAVPIVSYGLMPQLHKVRARIVTRSANN
jgi:antibiotic biosynthesis monooxygenase (ABM) superfamily enzyme